MTQQKGFTLIELVVVIVILGILAATALPKFVDMGTQAGTSAAKGVAGAMATASAMNYANRKVNGSGATVVSTVNICQEPTFWSAVMNSSLTLTATCDGSSPSTDTTYFICGGAASNCATSGATVTNCTVQGKSGGVQSVASVTCP